MTQLGDDLKALRDLFRPEGSWIRGRFRGYRTESGYVVHAGAGASNCWCLTGGLDKIFGLPMRPNERRNAVAEALEKTLNKHFDFWMEDYPEVVLVAWNDLRHRTKADVDRLLQIAVEENP